jgi:hypothetical protein
MNCLGQAKYNLGDTLERRGKQVYLLERVQYD